MIATIVLTTAVFASAPVVKNTKPVESDDIVTAVAVVAVGDVAQGGFVHIEPVAVFGPPFEKVFFQPFGQSFFDAAADSLIATDIMGPDQTFKKIENAAVIPDEIV